MEVLSISIGAGITLDVVSCFLHVARRYRGHGASGLPIVTLVAFYLVPLLTLKNPILTDFLWLDCVLAGIFHLVLVFFIPMLAEKVFFRRGS